MKRFLIIILMALPLIARAASEGDEVSSKTRFAWGAEAGSSIDLSGNDMSSIDFNATVGLSRGWISFLGAGVGADIMVSNSCRTYPMFALFRTDFSKRVKLLFMDVRVGAALNYLPNNVSQTTPYVSLNLGINLATGKTFRSYVLAGYTYIDRKDVTRDERVIPYEPLHLATIRLGIAF
ncbi:MAG: hypothetical protein K2M00_01095 [Muribaculaceae bacterium]|nr:hypothetical protein [Muribaculaceae bacterium]